MLLHIKVINFTYMGSDPRWFSWATTYKPLHHGIMIIIMKVEVNKPTQISPLQPGIAFLYPLKTSENV